MPLWTSAVALSLGWAGSGCPRCFVDFALCLQADAVTVVRAVALCLLADSLCSVSLCKLVPIKQPENRQTSPPLDDVVAADAIRRIVVPW